MLYFFWISYIIKILSFLYGWCCLSIRTKLDLTYLAACDSLHIKFRLLIFFFLVLLCRELLKAGPDYRIEWHKIISSPPWGSMMRNITGSLGSSPDKKTNKQKNQVAKWPFPADFPTECDIILFECQKRSSNMHILWYPTNLWGWMKQLSDLNNRRQFPQQIRNIPCLRAPLTLTLMGAATMEWLQTSRNWISGSW